MLSYSKFIRCFKDKNNYNDYLFWKYLYYIYYDYENVLF